MKYVVMKVEGDVITVWDRQTRQKWGSPIVMMLTVPDHGLTIGEMIELSIRKVEL